MLIDLNADFKQNFHYLPKSFLVKTSKFKQSDVIAVMKWYLSAARLGLLKMLTTITTCTIKSTLRIMFSRCTL